MRGSSLPGLVSLGCAVTMLIGFGGAIRAQVLPNIVEQFQEIQHSGAGLAFELGVGDDPDLWTSFGYCKHYQGLARMDVAGTSYFFLTRSGNHTTWGCPNGSDNPGELLVVEMASRHSEGERLRSNRLAVGTTQGSTVPPEVDVGIAQLHFAGGAGEPGWMHPGAVQLVDGVLVIPMKFYCREFSDPGGGQGVGAYQCTGDTVSDAANLIFVDVSEPTAPSILNNVDLAGQYGGAYGGYGAVAAIREPAGTYLFATIKSATAPLDFWRSTTTDLRDPAPWTLVWVGSWSPADLQPTAADWLDWQFINFVRDADGGLFLIGGKGGGGLFPEPISNGADWIRIFRVTEAPSGTFSLEWAGGDRASSERQLETEYPQMGNLDAAGAAYLSPTGQLIVYTAHHMPYVQGGTRYVAMGEFRNMDVHVSTTEAGLPPRLEVIDVDGDGDPETSCSGWIELYEDATGWDANGGPHRGEKFEYRDRYLEDWSNLHGDIEFGDETTALRWNLPPGQRALLFEHAGYGGYVRNTIPEGMGSVANLGSYWNDIISSVHLTPVADVGDDFFFGDPGVPIALEHANPCYIVAPPSEPHPIAFAWSMANEACEPIEDTGCVFDDPSAAQPMLTCSSAGEYRVRLTVTDPLPLFDSQFPWLPPGSYDPTDTECAVVYVPEPGRTTMLGLVLMGLVCASVRRSRVQSSPGWSGPSLATVTRLRGDETRHQSENSNPSNPFATTPLQTSR